MRRRKKIRKKRSPGIESGGKKRKKREFFRIFNGKNGKNEKNSEKFGVKK